MILFLLTLLLAPFPGQHDTPAPYPPPPVEGEIIPLFVTGYSWDTSVDESGCDHDCSVTAIGFPTSDKLLAVLGGPPVVGVAACPSAWVHLDIVRTVTIQGVGTFYCLDTFGSQEYREMRWIVGIGWVWHIDLALVDPLTAPYGLNFNYSLDWEWVYIAAGVLLHDDLP